MRISDWSSDVCSSDLRFRSWISRSVEDRKRVVAAVVGAFVVCVLAMGLLEQQFFPSSDRPEVLVEISLPQGTAIAVTERTARKVEAALRREQIGRAHV